MHGKIKRYVLIWVHNTSKWIRAVKPYLDPILFGAITNVDRISKLYIQFTHSWTDLLKRENKV